MTQIGSALHEFSGIGKWLFLQKFRFLLTLSDLCQSSCHSNFLRILGLVAIDCFTIFDHETEALYKDASTRNGLFTADIMSE